MPNKINLPYPPGLGAEDRELQSYLYKLVEQLNVCLESVDVEQISGAMKGTLERITGLSNGGANNGLHHFRCIWRKFSASGF